MSTLGKRRLETFEIKCLSDICDLRLRDKLKNVVLRQRCESDTNMVVRTNQSMLERFERIGRVRGNRRGKRGDISAFMSCTSILIFTSDTIFRFPFYICLGKL